MDIYSSAVHHHFVSCYTVHWIEGGLLMLNYPKDYEDSKNTLNLKLEELKTNGYKINTSEFMVTDNLSIDKIVIESKIKARNRLVLDSGLHGIEGYVGHACLMVFLDEFLIKISQDTEVVIYHPFNPFGMKYYRRNNENNVDLNRNFSTNDFANENLGFEKALDFFRPRKYSGIKRANISFYLSVIKMVLKYGTSTLKEATLLGQKIANDAIYYSDTKYQESTTYIIKEMNLNFEDIQQVVWIDLHTGYGPRYEMSIVNSKQETENNIEFSKKINYPRVLGLNADDFYDIDGDMIEMLYSFNKEEKEPIELYATCFEFGTLGESLLKSIKSLKAMLFENSAHFIPQSKRFKTYTDHLIKEQFLPSESQWKLKAYDDFIQSLTGILVYKKIIQNQQK